MNRDELRRLEKAARDKNKNKLNEWAEQYTRTIYEQLRVRFNDVYNEEIENSINIMMLCVAYVLHFSPALNLGPKRLPGVMEDLMTTIDMFRTGEYKPEDYLDQLKQCHIQFSEFDHTKIYKKYLNNMDTDFVNYMRSDSKRKIMTILGDSKYAKEIKDLSIYETARGRIVFTQDIYDISDQELSKYDIESIVEVLYTKILISDEVYIYNKNDDIGKDIEALIKYAKDHNKVINYLEPINDIDENKPL